MIIAVSAPPLFDKSEIIARLCAEQKLHVVKDPAPELCASFGFQTLYDMPDDLQRICRERLLTEHLAFLKKAQGVVLEFSAVEWLADWMRWFWGRTPTQAWTRIFALGAEAVRCYSSIYLLKEGRPKSYDGYVWLDRENSRQVGSLIHWLHAELGASDKVSCL